MSDNEYLNVAGKFKCVVEDPSGGFLTTRGAKETPAIRVPLLVQDGPQEGKKLSWCGYLTDASVEFTIRALATALDFDGNLKALQEGDISFAGQVCQVVTEFEEGEGEKRLKAKYINALGTGAPKIDEGKAASIIDSLGGKAKAIAKEALEAKGYSNSPSPSTASPF